MTLILDAAMPDIPPPRATTDMVPVGPHSDPAGALAPIEPRIREIASDAWAIEIRDQASYQAAADLLTEVKGMAKQVEGLEAIFVAPLETAAKKAKALFKPLVELLKGSEKRLKDTGKAYVEAEAAREAQKASARQAQAIATAPTPDAAAAAASAPAYVGPPPSAIGMSTQKAWTYKVEDIRTLARAVAEGVAPVEFLQVNAGQIQCAVRSGVREIPGVRIFQEMRMVSR